jgi:hypothetical protein
MDTLQTSWVARGVPISWKPLLKHHVTLEISENAMLLGPTKELLILFKCIDFVERSDRLQTDQTRYLKSKVWKDAQDVLALTKTGYDKTALDGIADEVGWQPIQNAARSILEDTHEEYGLVDLALHNPFIAHN